MKKLILILFFVLIAFLGIKTNFFSRLETSAPKVDLSNIPELIGADSKEVEIDISDLESGIYSAKIILEHDKERKVAYEKRIDGEKKELNLKLDLAKVVRQFKKNISNLDEGEQSRVKTIVEVRNNSFWHKKTIEIKQSTVDLIKPKLSVLSIQHAARKGGAEFVIFKAEDSNLDDVGIRIDRTIFKSIKLSEFIEGGLDLDNPDSKYNEKYSNLYAVLFALPIEMKGPVMIYARDTAGNMTQRKLKLRIRNFKRRDSKIKISENFVQNKVLPLYEEFGDLDIEGIDSVEANSVEVFKKVNQDYRMQLQKRLANLGLESKPISREKFVKPMAATTTSNFGESRAYSLDGIDAGGSTHDGLDLASVKRDKVLASNSGTVVLAEHFGIYGNAVVIDHGMGLISLYGHLSELEVSVGQDVERKEIIGRSGETGLAGGDHLHFEYRIANIPVNPREWLDANWVKNHVFRKIEKVSKSLSN